MGNSIWGSLESDVSYILAAIDDVAARSITKLTEVQQLAKEKATEAFWANLKAQKEQLGRPGDPFPPGTINRVLEQMSKDIKDVDIQESLLNEIEDVVVNPRRKREFMQLLGINDEDYKTALSRFETIIKSRNKPQGPNPVDLLRKKFDLRLRRLQDVIFDASLANGTLTINIDILGSIPNLSPFQGKSVRQLPDLGSLKENEILKLKRYIIRDEISLKFTNVLMANEEGELSFPTREAVVAKLMKQPIKTSDSVTKEIGTLPAGLNGVVFSPAFINEIMSSIKAIEDMNVSFKSVKFNVNYDDESNTTDIGVDIGVTVQGVKNTLNTTIEFNGIPTFDEVRQKVEERGFSSSGSTNLNTSQIWGIVWTRSVIDELKQNLSAAARRNKSNPKSLSEGSGLQFDVQVETGPLGEAIVKYSVHGTSLDSFFDVDDEFALTSVPSIHDLTNYLPPITGIHKPTGSKIKSSKIWDAYFGKGSNVKKDQFISRIKRKLTGDAFGTKAFSNKTKEEQDRILLDKGIEVLVNGTYNDKISGADVNIEIKGVRKSKQGLGLTRINVNHTLNFNQNVRDGDNIVITERNVYEILKKIKVKITYLDLNKTKEGFNEDWWVEFMSESPGKAIPGQVIHQIKKALRLPY